MLSRLTLTFTTFLFLMGMGQVSVAQSEKSRLNLGQSSKNSPVTKFSLRPSASSRSDLKKSYSQYYRQKLIVSQASKVETRNVSTPPSEPKVEKVAISNFYPNPVAQTATLDYVINAKVGTANIAFFNILGKKVAEFDLNPSNDKLRVNVSDWEPGIYLYQLNVDGKKISTKKLLVNK